MKLLGNMNIIDNVLFIGGVSVKDLREKYGTPLYVVDEMFVRQNIEEYKKNFKSEKFETVIAYAGKAFSTKYIDNIIKEEGLNIDVVSEGELYTALSVNFPSEKIIFHGNNKSYREVEYGVKNRIGYFVVDGIEEIEFINEIAKKENITQKILLRVSPGIEAHTHDYILTGNNDSKFGFVLENDEITNILKCTRYFENIKIEGLHFHIGSQIHELKPYEAAIKTVIKAYKKYSEFMNNPLKVLNIGGGKGIYYEESDTPITIAEFSKSLIKYAEETMIEENYTINKLIIEPGRSIIGEAGTTLYSVGSVKDIEGIRKYVSLDGGMTDNIRPALYGAKYSAIVANNVYSSKEENVTLAGKCCESGDILIKDITLPELKFKDIVAILSTGAYNYSMSSNYNKNLRPPVIAVKNGTSRIVVEGQNLEDLVRGENI